MEKSMARDWVCRKCQIPNFNWRKKCRRCNEPFVDPCQVHTSAPGPRVRNFRPGDWYCDAELCRAHNFATRQFCFKCGLIKSVPSFGGSVGYHNPVLPPVNFAILGQRVARISRRGWTTGDWFSLTAMYTIMVPEYDVTNAVRRGIWWLAMYPTNFVASKVPGLQYE
ncbi:hypothetical protein SSX86_023751 [Deinandra increscens subsp. villosa]|uniref:RanBP2-type domain-containing protein n=1 Tax=Deinandra increscens subsp. villosa TaxID=3103831 RepID=A0AAP0GRH5_9ASTR